MKSTTARNYIFIIAIFCVLHAYAETEEKWEISKSTHFFIYYKNAPEHFVEETINKSEALYDSIADSLGFTRYNFWTWDNRAKMYIYDSAVLYQAATKQPAWSAGAAIPREKTIHTFVYAKGFFERTLPHELGHIIFREFVGFDNPAIPVWLDEGVASFQEATKNQEAAAIVKGALKSKKLIPIEKLFTMQPQSSGNTETVQLFYAEAISIVEYLIKEFGKDSFVTFCQYLRDKKDFQRALCAVYPFSTIEEFNQAWQEHL